MADSFISKITSGGLETSPTKIPKAAHELQQHVYATTVVYKEKKNDWRKVEIVVTTIQSLMVNNKYKTLFSPTDFDLIISDESHRLLGGGNSRALFEYFLSYKLGLTATPKDYLKNVDTDDIDDPRELERRMLLDTYSTFGCESGQPTFRYSLTDGASDGFLIQPTVVDARTDVTTKLLSKEGYGVMVTVATTEKEDVLEEVSYKQHAQCSVSGESSHEKSPTAPLLIKIGVN